MNKDLIAVFDYMEREKGIERSIIIHAIEEALQAAAKKSIQGASNVSVQIHPKTGSIDVFCEKRIVEEVDLASQELSLEEARELDPDCELGQYIDVIVTPKDFGRIAAKKARDIINQKLRMAERNVIYEEYRHRSLELVSGTVKGFARGSTVIIDLGKVEAHMPRTEYPSTEKYTVGERVLTLLLGVEDTELGGARVVLSRSSPEFVKQLFIQEVPEVKDGTILIERIVREAGYRTKLTVSSSDFKVDPVGACVGLRGNRIKNVIRELNHEKIDIVQHANDPFQLLEAILDPIPIQRMIQRDENTLEIVVDDESYPKAIGKRGFNARLNGKLIGYELTVKRMTDFNRELALKRLELINSNHESLDQKLEELPQINKLALREFHEANLHTVRDLLEAGNELSDIPGGLEAMDVIIEGIYKYEES